MKIRNEVNLLTILATGKKFVFPRVMRNTKKLNF